MDVCVCVCMLVAEWLYCNWHKKLWVKTTVCRKQTASITYTHTLTHSHTQSPSLSLSPSQWTSRGLEKFTNTSSESDRQRGTQMTTKEFFNIAVRCVYAPSAKTNKIKQSDRVANSHCVWQCGREKNAAREGEEIRLKWGRRKRASWERSRQSVALQRRCLRNVCRTETKRRRK